mgnify:CR=1 FL=1
MLAMPACSQLSSMVTNPSMKSVSGAGSPVRSASDERGSLEAVAPLQPPAKGQRAERLAQNFRGAHSRTSTSGKRSMKASVSGFPRVARLRIE